MGEARSDALRADAAAPRDVDVRRIGRYTLVADLARGGMAELWVARRDGDRELRALKKLLDRFESHPTAAKRFLREAHLTSLLHHPNIVRTVDAGVEGGTFCVVSELVAGKNVAAIVEAVRALPSSSHAATGAPGALPQDLALAIVFAVLDAVIHAHELVDSTGHPLGIVHRDLTPRNVMVGYSGVVKVIDFGVARGNVDGFRTAAGVLVGSLEYVAPEQVQGEEVDARSDLYSICSVLYELLTGRPIIKLGPQLAEVVTAIVTQVPPPASSVNPAVPRAFDAVLARGLSKRASDRPASARELKAALEGAAVSARVAVASAAKLGGWLRALAPDGERWFLELQRAHEEHLSSNELEPEDLSIRTAVQKARIAEPTALVERAALAREGTPAFEATELVRRPSGFSRPAPGFDAPDAEPTVPPVPATRGRAPSRARPALEPPPELTKLGAVVLEMPGESVIARPRPRGRARWGLAVAAVVAALGLVAALFVTRARPGGPRESTPAAVARTDVDVRTEAVHAAPGAVRVEAQAPEPSAEEGSEPVVAAKPVFSTKAGPEARSEAVKSADGSRSSAKVEDRASSSNARADATRQTSSSDDRPAAADDRPAVTNDKPAITSDRPAAADDEPAVTNDQPAADDRPASDVAAPHRELRRLLRELRASSSRDNRRYVQLLEGISRAASNLEPAQRRAIEGELSSAELTYDVEVLARALATLMKAESR